MQSTRYVIVKVVIDHPSDMGPDEASDLVINECDYSLKFDDGNGVKIVDTEIVGQTDSDPS